MGLIVAKVGQLRLLLWSFNGAILGAILYAIPSQTMTAISMSLLGISLSAVYPLLMMETPNRVGKEISDHSVGLQVSAASLGAVALPSLAGFLSQRYQLSVIPYLTLAVAIILFGFNFLALRKQRNPI